MRYLGLAVAWAAYGALHSAMISESVTGFLKRKLGDAFRFYRLFFNAVALVTLVPPLLYTELLAGEPFFRWQGALLGVRFALLACGILLFIAGGRHYSLRQFIGISQLRRGASAGLGRRGGLDTSGILGLIRHPWYTGVVLLLWSGDLDTAHLVANSVLTVYIFVGTVLEERKLVREFGDAYRDYQKQVSMFVPLAWLRKRVSSTR